jgi:excinuclease UvrABC ATPase subunit
MSMTMSTGAKLRAVRVADSHDLIRVHGTRENNLKDVSVEIPMRRLTVFSGVSGSDKSSQVFGTLAAESRRLFNETHSAVPPGYLPTPARTEADVLRVLTTGIRDEQERPGANPRPTVGTVTDASSMLRSHLSPLRAAESALSLRRRFQSELV